MVQMPFEDSQDFPKNSGSVGIVNQPSSIFQLRLLAIDFRVVPSRDAKSFERIPIEAHPTCGVLGSRNCFRLTRTVSRRLAISFTKARRRAISPLISEGGGRLTSRAIDLSWPAIHVEHLVMSKSIAAQSESSTSTCISLWV